MERASACAWSHPLPPPPLSSLSLFHRRPTRTARPPSSCAASPTRNGIARACAATASSRPLSRRGAGAVRATTPRRERRGEGGRLFFCLERCLCVCRAARPPPCVPLFVRLLMSAASGRRGTSERGRRCVLLCCCCSGPKRGVVERHPHCLLSLSPHLLFSFGASLAHTKPRAASPPAHTHAGRAHPTNGPTQSPLSSPAPH